MELKPGSRWKSAVCDGEFVVVRPPKTGGELSCGGAAVIPHATAKRAGGGVAADQAGGTQLGKRYTDDESGIVILASKGGAGSLALDGRPLAMQDAKKLPASD